MDTRAAGINGRATRNGQACADRPRGGLAWNSTNSKISYEGTPIDSVSFGQTGWTAGIGAEWKANRRWSFFGEYDYMGFSPTTVSFPNAHDIGVVNQNVQAVLFGVNFHLN